MDERTAEADVDYENTARRVIRDIGYTRPEYDFDDSVRVEVSIHEQSPDIAMGVDSPSGDRTSCGAGDQGLMFGYASFHFILGKRDCLNLMSCCFCTFPECLCKLLCKVRK